MKVVLDSGETVELGTTEATPTIGIIDYSRRVTDDFGVTTVVQRGFARRMSVRLALPFQSADALQRRLADLRATPALWIADGRFASLSVRGFYKDFALDLSVPPVSYCTLTVEGLTGSAGAVDPGGDPAPEGQKSTLQMLAPVAIGAAQLVSSNVPENDAPEWSASAAYPSGVRVIKTSTHRIYESVAAVGAGDDPAALSGKWLDVGPTNRWAMFDQALGSVTSRTGSVAVTLSVAAVSAVALLDVVASTVRVQANGYDRTLPAGTGAITFLDLPANAGQITVTVAGGAAAVGTLLVGRLVSLGITEASPTAAIADFSRKVIDDFGEVSVVQRSWAKRMTAKALIRTDALDIVADRIAAVRALPSLWIGKAGLDSLTIYGFFDAFSIEVGKTVSKLSLSIEGLSTAGKVEPIKATVSWPEVTDPTGTKPTDNADKTADNKAKDTDAVGGRPAQQIIAGIDRIEPISEATDLLQKARIDQDAILRQADRDRAALAAAQIAGLLDQNVQRVTLRNAGMVTDPETGRVYLYAVDQAVERVSKVEIGLDAVSGQIALRATYNDVAVAIAQAQLSPGDAAEFGAIIARLNTVEVTLDSVNAALVLKADAITVTQLGGIVQGVSQTLDALAGTVATKVSYTDFNPIRDRVGTVEQTLLSFGDLSSYGITVRQAEVRGNAGTAAQLAGLLTSFETGQRQVVRAAEVQQQLYARLVDGDEAEAAARLLLSVRVGEAEGRIAQEQLIRASETSVLTQSVAGLTANFRDVSASVTQLSKAVSDGDSANAQLIAQVSARIGDFGIVSVQQAFAVLADRTGKLEGTVTVAIDTDGNLVGTKLIGSADGPGSLNLINANLRMGTGLVIYSAGTYERRGGAGFGSGRNLLEWFGPAAVPRGQETIANSRFATAADGKVYYGGADLDGGIGTSGKVKQLKLDGGVGGAGDGTAQLSVAAAVFPSGGKIKISGRLATASASNVDGGQPGENAGYWTIRFYANYGSGPQLIATAECSADVGAARVSDGVLALSGYLFDNPGPGGPVNLSAVVQRGGSPNSGIASQWTGSAIVEWVNA